MAGELWEDQGVRVAQALVGAAVGAGVGAGTGSAAAAAAGFPELAAAAAAVGAAGVAVAGAIGSYADSSFYIDPPSQRKAHYGKYLAGFAGPLTALAAATKVANNYGLTHVTPAQAVAVLAAAGAGGAAGGVGVVAAGAVVAGAGYLGYTAIQYFCCGPAQHYDDDLERGDRRRSQDAPRRRGAPASQSRPQRVPDDGLLRRERTADARLLSSRPVDNQQQRRTPTTRPPWGAQNRQGAPYPHSPRQENAEPVELGDVRPSRRNQSEGVGQPRPQRASYEGGSRRVPAASVAPRLSRRTQRVQGGIADVPSSSSRRRSQSVGQGPRVQASATRDPALRRGSRPPESGTIPPTAALPDNNQSRRSNSRV